MKETCGHRLKGASLNQWNEFANTWQDKGAKIVFGPLWNRAGWYGKEFEQKRKGLLRFSNPFPCSKPWDQIAVEQDGEVVLCSLDYKKVVSGGDHKASKMYLLNIQKLFSSDVIKAF